MKLRQILTVSALCAMPTDKEIGMLPKVSPTYSRIPDWPDRQSYRGQVRAARRRRDAQKRGGAK